MKKRNLLTLTALCMSLGLVVTACQGPQGQKGETGAKGEKGDTGAKGDKGDKGDKGEDGKTYQAVIVLGSNVDGGKIKQDKYFIQPGETFTLTFEADDEDGVLTYFEVNGEQVEVDPEAKTWSYTSTSTDAGWQVTAASFATVDDYLVNSIKDHYSAMCKADLGLATISIKQNASEYSTDDAKAGTYSDTKQTVSKLAAKELNAAIKALKGLSSKATTKEKLAKADELVAAANKSIDESYSALVASQKKLALNAFESALNKETAGANKGYYSADAKASLLADGKAAIEKATTLQGINEVYSKEEFVVEEETKTGSYYTLLEEQSDVLEAYTTALNAVDSVLKTGSDATSKAKVASITSILATYGVSVDKLPSTIAQEYADQVISSRSLEKASEKTSKYDEGDILLEVDGVKAIEDATKNVLSALYTGIVESFNNEINALSSTTSATKTALLQKIEKNASDWKKSDKNDGTILKMLGYKENGKPGTSAGYEFNYDEEDSLVATLEAVLSSDENVTSEIKAERLNNVLSTYETKWANELAKVLEDEEYADDMSFTKDGDTYTLNNEKLLVLDSTNDVEIENFAFNNTENWSSEVSNAEKYGDKKEYDYYSAKAVYEALVNGETSNATGTAGGNLTSIKSIKDGKATKDYSALDAKAWASSVDGKITKGYEAFRSELSDQIMSKLAYDNYDPTYISTYYIVYVFAVSTQDSYGNTVVDVESLKEAGQNAYDSISVCEDLDKGISTFVTNKGNNTSAKENGIVYDSAFNAGYINAGVGKFYDGMIDELLLVVTGQADANDVANFVTTSNLEALWASDVNDYATKALERLDVTVSNLINTDKTMTLNQVTLMQNRLAEVKTVIDLANNKLLYVSSLNGQVAEKAEDTTTGVSKDTTKYFFAKLGVSSSTKSTSLTIKNVDDFYTVALNYVQFGFAKITA